MEKGGEEAGGRHAGVADGDIGGLDAGEEGDPVGGEDGPAPGNLEQGFPADRVETAREGKDQGQGHDADHDPVPDQRRAAEGDQPAEDSGPSCQEDRQVEDRKDAGIAVVRCVYGLFNAFFFCHAAKYLASLV